MISADFAAPVLFVGMIVSLGAILFAAYTVYIDQNASHEYKLKMYIFYAVLIVLDAVVGVISWIALQSGG
jgi:hypothetical protein